MNIYICIYTQIYIQSFMYINKFIIYIYIYSNIYIYTQIINLLGQHTHTHNFALLQHNNSFKKQNPGHQLVCSDKNTTCTSTTVAPHTLIF